MDKGTIKKFAVSSRKKLMAAVEQKAFELGIEKEKIKKAEIYQDGFLINQKFYKKYEIKQRERLIREMDKKGYAQVIEEVAYTWFNRFIALRFMEVNDYLPSGIRIFSSIEEGKAEPDALTEVLMLVDELDLNEAKVYELQDANATEDLFKYILIKQCNKLGELLPMMFEEIEDYTELLLPDQLLADTSVIHDMVTWIAEGEWTEEVEIIGWLYQYYISEKKDEVFADLKKNKKISKENIPAATELFTPRWIVQYMVDNSLGRLWLESHSDDNLQKKLPYFLEEAEQPDSVVEQLNALKDLHLDPKTITFLDPCMGSGHILVYAFEVFYEIYKSQGYRERDIPKLIIENNLYGLDIDPRAAQLANFSVLMKARSYNYRLFDSEIHTNLHWIEESNLLIEEDIELFSDDTNCREELAQLMETFENGKLLGSIIEVPEIDVNVLRERIAALKENNTQDMFVLEFIDHALPIIERLVDQAEVLARKYDVVVTNPPYMGRKGMDAELGSYVKKHFPITNSDLFAVMMKRIEALVKECGFSALVTMQSWMFLSSYEKYRNHLLDNYSIVTLTHMANMVMGIAFGTAATIFRKKIRGYKGVFQYIEYEDIIDEKPYEFPITKNRYSIISGDSFSDIPGSPIAYWVSEQVRKSFYLYQKLGEYAKPKQGLSTCNNDLFLREWHEIEIDNIGFFIRNRKEGLDSNKKWFPYNKGGGFRKWYGNNDLVVNWKDDGLDIHNYNNIPMTHNGAPVRNKNYYYKKGLTWSSLTSGNISFRHCSEGFIFDAKGPMLFSNDENFSNYFLGALNSKVIIEFLKILAPTLDFNQGPISKVPIDVNQQEDVDHVVEKNISISKSDWDSFETSWDFKTHPFIEFKQNNTKISDAYNNWQQKAESRFRTLKENEEKLNRIFIDLYGLQNELTPEVEDKDITINRAERERDVKSFISYTVGLMLGRYSLDSDGLAFAGGEFDPGKYKTIKPDSDNVIPITDDVYFEDGIVRRFIEMVKTIFGADNLEENLDFIADTLARKSNETSRQRIRRYFLKEFYKDHVKTYQKRPIYWLFDSGKENGFKALVYLHRYEPGLVAKVRTEYLHAQQRKYEEEIQRLNMVLESDVSKPEHTRAKKQKERLQKQLEECLRYDQVIAHIANQKIALDLDDGVKVNYAKFQQIEIPLGEGKKPLQANLLAKI